MLSRIEMRDETIKVPASNKIWGSKMMTHSAEPGGWITHFTALLLLKSYWICGK